MSSIIEGYNYDIFISYRHKDNKYDGWVTEFVENLKKELEATFKKEISVYFDINPHDGLLETYDVDESLKEKLKCLVFIPIISRTYCDPKSFAWEHEFKVFMEEASKDQFGLKVKLLNGHVASRILPVMIYDLDNEDIKLCESVIGGVVRGVEFIYDEPGVNRPLKPDDDEKLNLKKTKYRNQINKVGNAIKEIITSIEHYSPQKEEVSIEVTKPISERPKNHKTTIVAASAIAVALVILSILFIPKLFKPEEQLEKSIAVLPFIDDSPDENNSHIINGLMDEILINLQRINDLIVISRNSVEQFRGENKPSTPDIARTLGVNYIVEGSGQKYGNNLRLRVQLIVISKGKERHLWGKVYDNEINNPEDYLNIQSNVAESIADELRAIMTPEEKQLIENTPTLSLTAYDFYRRGREEYLKFLSENENREALEKSEAFYSKALRYDSTYAMAYVGLAWVYWDKHFFHDYISANFMDSVLVLCNIALNFDNQLAEAYTLKGTYYSETGKPELAIEEFDKALKSNPNEWIAYRGKGEFYFETDWVNYIKYLQKAVFINRGPELPDLLSKIGYAYFSTGFTEKAKQYYHDKLKLDGDSSAYFSELARIELRLGSLYKSLEFGLKSYAMDSTNAMTLVVLADNCTQLGRYEESLKYCFLN